MKIIDHENGEVLMEGNTSMNKLKLHYQYKSSGWASFHAILGWVCIFLAVAFPFVMMFEAVKNSETQPDRSLYIIIIQSSAMLGAGITLLFMAFVINTLTQIRDNSRYLLLEVCKQNEKKDPQIEE